MVLKYIIEKEFRQMVRNPIIPRLIVVFPCVMMLLMPWAATLEIKMNQLCVVDSDCSTLSKRLVEQIGATDYFRLTGYVRNYNEALASVESGESDLILEIPADFERNLMRGDPMNLQISANAVNGTKGALGSSYLMEVVQDFMESEARTSEKRLNTSVQIAELNLFNPRLDYKVFMIPALIVMLLTMLCGFLPALNIVSEKEVGTIEQLNVTPLGKWTFILGKLIPYWIVGFIALTLCLLFSRYIYGLIPVGSLSLLYFMAFIYILIMSGVGLVISNYSATMQQAMFVTFFFMLVFILLSGLFTPVRSMPLWAQWVARINPLTYFNEVMRMIFLKGSSFRDLLFPFFMLSGFMLVFNIWAVWSYRKSE